MEEVDMSFGYQYNYSFGMVQERLNSGKKFVFFLDRGNRIRDLNHKLPLDRGTRIWEKK